MKLRAPSVPLITVDPYFSVWSPADHLTDAPTCHWTGHPNSMLGTVTVDGKIYRFMGLSDTPAMRQTDLKIDALNTVYTFACDEILLTAAFMTPLLPQDLYLLSRPVSYLKLSYTARDGKKHAVSYDISLSEEFCLNEAGQSPILREEVAIEGLACMRMGNCVQNVLNRSGDDVRIDWGYVYLGITGQNAAVVASEVTYARAAKEAEAALLPSLTAHAQGEALVLFAYDDIRSMVYFGKQLPAYWNKDGMTIEAAIREAAAAYPKLVKKAAEFSDRMYLDAVAAGGEQYADLLALAYRQVIAAHKLVVDEEGEVLFISKECFSNGCAATVDVSYPSIPLFLHYNPELVKGMMRPIFRYAQSEAWPYDFAPHDAGQYPLVNGQVYGYRAQDGSHPLHMQMPVEECGNMLIMAAAVAVAQQNTSFVRDHMDVLEQWAQYLLQYGQDPENQLCTDDFAGHLAHNCNLSLKAIMGLTALSLLLRMTGKARRAAEYEKRACAMAAAWQKTAANGDGSYRLAFDREGTFSMKYNAVWDKLFGTHIFPAELLASEAASNFRHVNPYGMPLDNRADYTKSDWLVWTATLFESDDDFRRFIAPLWRAYHHSPSRVPMTDWYDTITAKMIGFQHRTVQGGLYIKLLEKDFREKAHRLFH